MSILENLRLKTTRDVIVEKCELDVNNSLILHLKGPKAASSDLNVGSDIFDEKSTFANILGKDCKFYYQLMVFKNSKITYTEVGLATLVEDDKVDRLFCLNAQDDNGSYPNPAPLTAIANNDIDFIHVAAYPIQTTMQLMLDREVIPVCTLRDGPAAIYMEANCLLGKDNDTIKSIAASTLHTLVGFSDSVINALASYTKQVSLKISKLFCKQIETNELVLYSIPKHKAQEGAVIYDNASKCLKVFDGTSWRQIAYEDT